MQDQFKQRLSRLEPENYRGLAWVHWVITIEDRKTGWLDPRFLYKFREVLTHAAFRYQFACPIFCLMPDHIHLLWCGLSDRQVSQPMPREANQMGSPPRNSGTFETDQRVAMKSFRKDLNNCLKRIGYEVQTQPYDHVLREEECELSAIEKTAEYIARNPERKQIVPIDQFAKYRFTGCLLPGYPQLKLFGESGWDAIWRTLSFLKRTECFHLPDPRNQS